MVKVHSKKFSSKYVFFTIFYVYIILVYIYDIHHWMPTYKVTEEVKTTTINRENTDEIGSALQGIVHGNQSSHN